MGIRSLRSALAPQSVISGGTLLLYGLAMEVSGKVLSMAYLATWPLHRANYSSSPLPSRLFFHPYPRPHPFSHFHHHQPPPRPSGELWWVHLAGLGEIKACQHFICALQQYYPGITILITTNSPDGMRYAQQATGLQPPPCIITYAPWDSPSVCRRFLNYWQPQYVIFFESELWPWRFKAIRQRRRNGTCQGFFLINARISARSLRRWLLFRHLTIQMLTSYDLIFTASTALRDSLLQLLPISPDSIRYYGNIKYDRQQPHLSPAPATACPPTSPYNSAYIGASWQRPVVVCGSIYKAEYADLVQTHAALLSLLPNLLTVLAPRKMEDIASLCAVLTQHKLSYRLHSQSHFHSHPHGPEIHPSTSIHPPAPISESVYILDTVGELSIFYHFATAVYIGGALYPGVGGHNVLEATALGKPVITGPYHDNFADIIQDLHQERAILICTSQDEIQQSLITLLTNPVAAATLGLRAQDASSKKQGVGSKIIADIDSYIRKHGLNHQSTISSHT